MEEAFSCRIGSLATAWPAFRADQAAVRDFFLEHGGRDLQPKNVELLRQVFDHPGIRQRRFAVTDGKALAAEDPDQRHGRFAREALNLSQEAAARALHKAGLRPDQVGAVVVNTCTGYLCPGLSTYLLEGMGLDPGIRCYDLVGGGCSGALPNLQVSRQLAQQLPEPQAVLSVAVEICSAVFRMKDDPGVIISNALFGDGAAAAVIWRRPQGPRLMHQASRFLPKYRDELRFVYHEGQLLNQLSVRLPAIVRREAQAVVADLLQQAGLRPGDIAFWALHPGGAKIIDALGQSLGLPEAKLAATRRVLSEYGNLSSAGVWFVLKDLWDSGLVPGTWGVMLSFGAGLAIHGCLIQA